MLQKLTKKPQQKKKKLWKSKGKGMAFAMLFLKELRKI